MPYPHSSNGCNLQYFYLHVVYEKKATGVNGTTILNKTIFVRLPGGFIDAIH